MNQPQPEQTGPVCPNCGEDWLRPTAVAGKSGTAETPSGNPDAWFIGFAPYDGPKLAIATLFEEKPGLLGSQDAGAATRAVFAAKFGGNP